LKDLPTEADTVIVGGGVAGTSIAYHLAKQVRLGLSNQFLDKK